MQTSGLDRIAEMLRVEYGSVMRVTSAARIPSVRMEQDQLPGVRLDHLIYDIGMRLDSEPLDRLYVGCLRTGHLRYDYRGQQHRHEPGDVFIGGGYRQPFTVDFDGPHVIDWVAIDPRLLAQLVDAAPGAPADPGGASAAVRPASLLPVSAAAARRWTSTLRFVRRTVRSDPDSMDNPLVAGQTARMLAAVAADTFGVAPLVATGEKCTDPRPRTLRRAIAFIEAHPDRDLTVSDIADAACATPRAVQLAFRRHLDTTPMSHLRRVRLDHAHRQLRAADPQRTTVREVALRWGFADGSRFAASYRAEFGESPSQTLRQGERAHPSR